MMRNHRSGDDDLDLDGLLAKLDAYEKTTNTCPYSSTLDSSSKRKESSSQIYFSSASTISSHATTTKTTKTTTATMMMTTTSPGERRGKGGVSSLAKTASLERVESEDLSALLRDIDETLGSRSKNVIVGDLNPVSSSSSLSSSSSSTSASSLSYGKTTTKYSASEDNSGSPSSSPLQMCRNVWIGSPRLPLGRTTLEKRRSCDRLRCLKCDFEVKRFPERAWVEDLLSESNLQARSTTGSSVWSPPSTPDTPKAASSSSKQRIGSAASVSSTTSTSSSTSSDHGHTTAIGGSGPVDYLFFRHNIFFEEALRNRTIADPSSCAYCCQCDWINVREDTTLDFSSRLRWACLGHSQTSK